MKKQKVSTGDEMFLVRVQEMQLEWAALVYFIKSPGSAKEATVRTYVSRHKTNYPIIICILIKA